jgi:hypothetical protein
LTFPDLLSPKDGACEFSAILQLESQRRGQFSTYLPKNLKYLPSTLKGKYMKTKVLALLLA